MKTKIEMSGYEIEIEMHEDSISIKVEKDEEVVEELSLPLTDESDEDFEDEDFEDSEMEDEDSEMEEEDFDEELPMDDDEGKMESFQSYFKKRNTPITRKKVALKKKL